MIGAGTPFDALFATLTDRMGVPHSTDDDPSQRDRVVWERAGALVPGPIRYTRPGEKTIGRLGHPWTASVFGASDLEVSARVAELWGHIDEIVGPPQGCETPGHDGYAFTPGKVAPQGGDAVSAGWACDVAVMLFVPVASQIRPPATVATVTATATAPAAGDATNPGSIAWAS